MSSGLFDEKGVFHTAEELMAEYVLGISRNESEAIDTRPANVRILTAANRKNGAEIEKKCIAYINSLVQKKEHITAKRVTLGVGCSVSFVYKNPKVRAYLDKARRAVPQGRGKQSEAERLLIEIAELEKENVALNAKYLALLKSRIADLQREEIMYTEIISNRLRGIRDKKYKYVGQMSYGLEKEIDADGFLVVREDNALWKLE